MPTPLGYLTENAMMNYPFKDGCSLKPNGVTSRLENDVLVDFQFSTSDRTVRKVALTKMQGSTGGYGYMITFTFTVFKYVDGWTTVTRAVDAPASTTTFNSLVSADFGSHKIKLVAGAGLISLLAKGTLFNWVFPYNLSTGEFAAEMSPSTVLPVLPTVSRIHFQNAKETSDVLNVALAGPVTIDAGSNILFKQLPTSIGFNVEKGAGTGLYDPCIDPILRDIKTINGIASENFSLMSGDCYKTVYHVSSILPAPADSFAQTPGLEFVHTCRPKCTQSEVSAFAYYSNRVQDGVNSMNDYIKGVVDKLKTEIALNALKNFGQIVSPYIDAQEASTIFNQRLYESISVGIFDPNKQRMSCDLVLTSDLPIATESYFASHPAWTGWVLKSDAVKLEEENNHYLLPSGVAADQSSVSVFSPITDSVRKGRRGIDCRGSVVTSLILHTAYSNVTPLHNKWVQFALNSYSGDTVTATAFKHLTLLPDGVPYLNVKANKGIRENGNGTFTHVHTVSIEFFDSNATRSLSDNSSFSLTSASHAIVNPVLKINNGQAVPVNTTTSTISFNNVDINYPQRAVLTFHLEAAASTQVSLGTSFTIGSQTVERVFTFY